MTKVLDCGDVVPGCPAQVRADDAEDALRRAADHARSAHGLEQLDDATLARVRAAIRSE